MKSEPFDHIATPWSKSIGKPSRKRGITVTTEDPGARPAALEGPLAEANEFDLIRAAYNEDDVAAADELRRRYEDDPENLIRCGLGRIERIILIGLLEKVGRNDFQREAIEARIEEIKANISGANPTPLEKLLINRILLCWLDLQYRDHRALPGGNQSIRLIEHLDKMRDKSNKRYLASIKALAVLRKLEVQSVQVNITSEGGPQQVNLT